MKTGRYICILAIILFMTIFTIAEGTRTIKIGYEIPLKEKELVNLLEENKNLKYKLDKSKTLEMISQKVNELQLGLVMTDDEGYIIIVNEACEKMNGNPHGKRET